MRQRRPLRSRLRRRLTAAVLAGAVCVLAWPAAAAAVPSGSLVRTSPTGVQAQLRNNDSRDILAVALVLNDTSAQVQGTPAALGVPGACEVSDLSQRVIECLLSWYAGNSMTIDFATLARYPELAGAQLSGCYAPCGPPDNFGPVNIPGPGQTATGGPTPQSSPTPTTPGAPVLGDLTTSFTGADPATNLPFDIRESEVVIALGFVTTNLGPPTATGVRTEFKPLSLPPDSFLFSLSRGECRTTSASRNAPYLCDYGALAPRKLEPESMHVALERPGLVSIEASVTGTPDAIKTNNTSVGQYRLETLPDSRIGSHTLSSSRPEIRVVSTGDQTIPSAAGASASQSGRRGTRSSLQVAIARLDGPAKVASAAGRSRRRAASCQWVRSVRGTLKRERAVSRRCDEPVWLNAKQVRARRKSSRRRGNRSGRRRAGTRQEWIVRLRRRLPCGPYVVLTRAVGPTGAFEARFSRRDGNRRATRVRRRNC